jgi:UDP-apiose/xylose synthase
LGAGGFLGSHLVESVLAHTPHLVEAVDLTLTKLERRDERLILTQASIRDRELIANLVARCDVVVSLTALCNPALYNTKPLEVIDANYQDLVPVCDLCAEKRTWLIHFSTCEVYGRASLGADNAPRREMSEEESALVLGPIHRERWTYACAKQLLERRLWALGRHHHLPFTIVRPFNVIGPRMDFLPGRDGEGIPRVLACFMHALLSGAPLPLVDGGRQRRSFIGTEDFCRAVLAILERPAPCRGQILNIGNPHNDVTIADLARGLADAFATQVPNAPPAVFRDVRAEDYYGDGYDDVFARIPDIAKAKRLLDWSPQTTLAAALPTIVADYVRRYGPPATASAPAR